MGRPSAGPAAQTAGAVPRWLPITRPLSLSPFLLKEIETTWSRSFLRDTASLGPARSRVLASSSMCRVQGSIQSIRALEWVNRDTDTAQILPTGLSQEHYRPDRHLRTREDGQTHLLDIAAGSGQMPGATAGSPSGLFPWSPNLCRHSHSAQRQSFRFNFPLNDVCGFFSELRDLLAVAELPVRCCWCFAALHQHPSALQPPQGAHFNVENPK